MIGTEDVIDSPLRHHHVVTVVGLCELLRGDLAQADAKRLEVQ
jgi:hypothetical protein